MWLVTIRTWSRSVKFWTSIDARQSKHQTTQMTCDNSLSWPLTRFRCWVTTWVCRRDLSWESLSLSDLGTTFSKFLVDSMINLCHLSNDSRVSSRQRLASLEWLHDQSRVSPWWLYDDSVMTLWWLCDNLWRICDESVTSLWSIRGGVRPSL
jgi:hypothetical protein